MKKHPVAPFLVAGLLLLMSFGASAQTSVIVTTNIVTVMVTNIVTMTVTNVVTTTNALVKAEAAPAASPVASPPQSLWDSSITTGLTLTRGNSDTLLFTAGVLTDRKTADDEIKLGANAAYGESGGVKNLNTASGFGQYNHLLTDRFYGYGRGDALRDEIADLQYRFTLGPGVGYFFLRETNTTFAGEFGSSFVTQRLGNEDDNFATLRLAERFEHRFKYYGARVWQSAEILPQVDKFDNYVINAEIGIEAALNSHFSLKTFLDNNFNNQPAAGRQKNDVKLVSGISYRF